MGLGDTAEPFLVSGIPAALDEGNARRHEHGILSHGVRVDPYSPAATTIERAAGIIRQGGVVLHPTDTIYGLGCDPFCPQALRRLFEIKGRPPQKGLLLLVPASTWVEKICDEIPEVFYPAAREFWPGPVTFLLPANPNLPSLVRGGSGKVGLRQPALPYLDSWMKAIPGPLVSTSANRSGQESPGSIAALRKLFQDEVDLLLEANEVEDPRPSVVVDLTLCPPRIVREGRGVERVKGFLREL